MDCYRNIRAPQKYKKNSEVLRKYRKVDLPRKVFQMKDDEEICEYCGEPYSDCTCVEDDDVYPFPPSKPSPRLYDDIDADTLPF